MNSGNSWTNEDSIRVLDYPCDRALKSIVCSVRRGGIFSLAVHGSQAVGEQDEYSDVDITLAFDRTTGMKVARDELSRLLARLGEVLVQFDANHLGFSDFVVSYILHSGRVVKVDSKIATIESVKTLPEKTIIVHDPEMRLNAIPLDEIDLHDETIFSKLIGWLWYSYVLLERGEYFAAARSLDFSREHGLLPLVRKRMNLRQDGHRRIESLLTDEALQRLKSTYPTRMTRESIFRSLTSMYVMVRSELEKNASLQCQLASKLEKMWEIITRCGAEDGHRRSG